MKLEHAIMVAGMVIFGASVISPTASATSVDDLFGRTECAATPWGPICVSLHKVCGDLADGNACNPQMACELGVPQEACNAVDPYCSSEPGQDGCRQYFHECANAVFSDECDLKDDVCGLMPVDVPSACVPLYDTVCVTGANPVCVALACDETGMPVCMQTDNCSILKPGALLTPTRTILGCGIVSLPSWLPIPDVDLTWVPETIDETLRDLP